MDAERRRYEPGDSVRNLWIVSAAVIGAGIGFSGSSLAFRGNGDSPRGPVAPPALEAAASQAAASVDPSDDGPPTLSEKGFSPHQVDAEAGLHPNRPSPDDQRVVTDQEHVYWVRTEPILKGGLVDVHVVQAEGVFKIILRMSDEDAKLFHAFTTSNTGPKIAFVLNGRMIGEPIRVMGPISGTELQLPQSTNRMYITLLCDEFERAKEAAASASGQEISKCPGIFPSR